jgi:hypothetical protein
VVQGYAYASAATVVLSNSATPPPGGMPISNGRIQVSGSTASVTTDASGKFTFPEAPAGARTLFVTPPGGAPVGKPVTVIAGSTVTVGDTAFTRQQAIDAVKTEVAKTDDLADVLIMATSQPIPAGVTISPALGNDAGAADPLLELKSTTTSWFIYADRRFGQRFQHAVRYYLVDAATGAITFKDASSWPLVNGARLYGDDETNRRLADAAIVPTRSPSSRAASDMPVGHVALSGRTRNLLNRATFSLLIQGDSREDFAADFTNVKGSFVNAIQKDNQSIVETYQPSKTPVTDPAALVKQKFAAITATADERDSLFVFVTAHGTKNGGLVLGSKPVEDGSKEDRTPLLVLQSLPWDSFRGHRIVIIIESCYSGFILDRLSQYFTANDEKFLNKCVTVMASSSAREASIGVTGGDNKVGSYFMNALIASVAANGGFMTEENTGNIFPGVRETTLNNTKDETTSDDPTDLKGQHARIFRRATTEEEAVRLDRALGSEFFAGQCVPLRRIENGKITNESGCAGGRHLHAVDARGIRIDRANLYADPNKTGCGYGLIVMMKK